MACLRAAVYEVSEYVTFRVTYHVPVKLIQSVRTYIANWGILGQIDKVKTCYISDLVKTRRWDSLRL